MQSCQITNPEQQYVYHSNHELTKDYSNFLSVYHSILNAYKFSIMMCQNELLPIQLMRDSTISKSKYTYIPYPEPSILKSMYRIPNPKQSAFFEQTLRATLYQPILEHSQSNPTYPCKPIPNLNVQNSRKSQPINLNLTSQTSLTNKPKHLWHSTIRSNGSGFRKLQPRSIRNLCQPNQTPNPNSSALYTSTSKHNSICSLNPDDIILTRLAKLPNTLGPYVCRLCHVLFDNAIKLAKHRCPCILHTDYRCPECDKVFNCPANLASHRRWHKPNRPKQPIQSLNGFNSSSESHGQMKISTLQSKYEDVQLSLSMIQTTSDKMAYPHDNLRSLLMRESRDQNSENNISSELSNLYSFKQKSSFKSKFTVQSILDESPKSCDHVK